ncbi:hypothetical protein ACWC10_03935 [Streptomyces sp. NPDC001595]|uniref:hypothetical protein n=1 Tax=Streptomyces sp. NPDC001532 TaxID=3154520 RepID=UPI00332375EF
MCGAWLPPYGTDDGSPWWRLRRRHRAPPPRLVTSAQRTRAGERPRDTWTGELRTDDSWTDPPPLTVQAPPPSLVLRGSGTVEGEAQDVRMRSEVNGRAGSASTTVVCTFRVEVRDRRSRQPLRLVAVEMRGDTFEGAVSDGDWVRATGEFQRGTLRVWRLSNLTTGAEVSAGRTNVVAIGVILVLFVAYMLFLFGFVAR